MGRMSDSQYQSKSAYAHGGAGFRQPITTSTSNTSQQAAKAVQKSLNANEQKVFDVLKQYWDGLTADQIAFRLDWHVTRVRPRLTGLQKKLKIRKTGETRKSEMGKPSAVYVVLVGRG